MLIISEITEKVCVKDKYLTHSLESENLANGARYDVMFMLVSRINRKWHDTHQGAAISATAELLFIYPLIQ